MFESTKALLTNPLPPLVPAFDCSLKVAVDASNASVGAVLEDVDDHVDDDHPVSYFSEEI